VVRYRDGRIAVMRAPVGGESRAAAALRLRPDVAEADPDYIRHAAATPNDPGFPDEWALLNTGQSGGTAGADIHAPDAWNLTTGSSSVIVAVADTGVDDSHTDLAANMWRNPGETGNGRETNQVDDDANGFVDDWRGWDFVDGDNNPADENPLGHGTFVSGVIGARGNNWTGVTGVAWSVRIMALRVLDKSGNGSSSDAIKAYQYASRMGASVLNGSFSGENGSNAERTVISGLTGMLFTTVAGNESVNNDVTPSYPCNYGTSNMICVAATDANDQLAGFSNYGSSVQLAAPGVGIVSTRVGNSYALSSGTSAAAPFVAGAAALVKALTPGATTTSIRSQLLTSVDGKPSLLGKVSTGGRLNAAGALGAGTSPPDTTPPSVPVLSGSAFTGPFHTQTTVAVGWSSTDSGSGVASYDARYRRAPSNATFGAPLALRTGTTASGASINLAVGYTYCVSARATDRAGNVSSWSAERCTAAPLDDRGLSASGRWTRGTGGYYLGTYSYSTQAGASLRRSVAAKRIALVATKCSGCGTVDVFWGSTLLRRISLSALTTRRSQIIDVATFSSIRTGTLTIKVRTSGRKVIVEGAGVSRV
jgi:subtilisin family serine protease